MLVQTYIIFSSSKLAKTLKLKLQHLKFSSQPRLKTIMLSCARTLPEASWLRTLEHLDSWRSIHIQAVVISKEPHHLAEVRQKLVHSLNQLCPIQMAYWAKKYVTILTRAAHRMTHY